MTIGKPSSHLKVSKSEVPQLPEPDHHHGDTSLVGFMAECLRFRLPELLQNGRVGRPCPTVELWLVSRFPGFRLHVHRGWGRTASVATFFLSPGKSSDLAFLVGMPGAGGVGFCWEALLNLPSPLPLIMVCIRGPKSSIRQTCQSMPGHS